MSRKIKSILFDLDGTLRLNLPASGEVFADCAKGMGVHASEEDRHRAERWEHFYFAHSLEIQKDSKKFKDDQKGFWVNFTRRRLVALGVRSAQAAELAPHISDCMESTFKPQAHVSPHAIPLLEQLKGDDYVLGVVSNRDTPFQDELDALNLKHYFRFTLAGGEVKSFKPEPRIFERALELAGTHAKETMYIGDNYFADVVGARRAGLLPVLYDPRRLFPDAECSVIRSFDELPSLLQ